MRKKAASVLLKLFISDNEGCHTTDAPYTVKTFDILRLLVINKAAACPFIIIDQRHKIMIN